jgi:hypothetical protein
MSDLKQIIMRGHESKAIDYKGPGKWDEANKAACCEIVKDILAMSNTGGGYLVFGVAEKKDCFEYVGLSTDELGTFETSRVNRFLQNYADPPINCIIVKEQIENRNYVVIKVPGFMETPHICKKEFHKVLQPSGLYVRTDSNESALVQSSADFRRVIERAVRNKQDELLESFRAILTSSSAPFEEQRHIEQYETELSKAVKTGTAATFYDYGFMNQNKFKGYREFWCYPVKYDQDRYTLSQLHEVAQRSVTDFRGLSFLVYSQRPEYKPYAIDGGIEAKICYEYVDGRVEADYWQLRQNGLFYQRRLMWEETLDGKNQVLYMMSFKEPALYTAEALHTMVNLYDSFVDVDEEVGVGVRHNGTDGRMLTSDSRPLTVQYISKMDPITYEKTRSLADWRAGLVDHSLKVARFVLERFNWETPNIGACKDAIDKMFLRQL